MPDIVSITATITAIKNSIDIAKALKDAEASIEKAELKLKIAELIQTLAEAKISAAEVSDLIQEKDKKIVELENLSKFKAKLIRKNGLYYENDENGNIVDDPYCSVCWEVNQIAVHIKKSTLKCLHCKNSYGNSFGTF